MLFIEVMKTNLIVGASSGIGAALAKLLISRGEAVISISRHDPQLEQVEHLNYDVTSGDSLPVVNKQIDSIIYCPGSINLKSFKALKPEDFARDFELNVVGAIRCIQRYMPNLSESANGSIVLFSTVAVQTGMPFHSCIAASKGAVEGLTRSLAAEFAPKIRVNCIAPSLTETPLAEKLLNTPEKKEASANRHPLKRIGDPAHIAGLAAFLVSEEASFITGQIIHMDGGMASVRVG